MRNPSPRHFDGLVLATARLTLRALDETDAPGLFGVFSDPRVMRYWSSPPWDTEARAHEMIGQDRKAMRRGDYVRLGVETRESREFIGTCTLFALAAQCRRAELGYALHSAWWGRGYMHEALTALLAFGFDELDLNRVEADVDPRNLASVRILERLGFRKEGHLRERWIVAGEVSDSGLYGLLRHDWTARASHDPTIAVSRRESGSNER